MCRLQIIWITNCFLTLAPCLQLRHHAVDALTVFQAFQHFLYFATEQGILVCFAENLGYGVFDDGLYPIDKCSVFQSALTPCFDVFGFGVAQLEYQGDEHTAPDQNPTCLASFSYNKLSHKMWPRLLSSVYLMELQFSNILSHTLNYLLCIFDKTHHPYNIS